MVCYIGNLVSVEVSVELALGMKMKVDSSVGYSNCSQ